MGQRRVQAGTCGIVLLMLGLAAACGPSRARVDYGLQGGGRYLCCTLRFNKDHDANDGGYVFGTGTTLPAGTPVQVVAEDDRRVTLQPEGSADRYNLGFRYGRNAITAGQFFQEVLLRDDPRPHFARMTPEVRDAVARGELRVGMTKAEALAARGYPPRHRTSGVDADEWLYYQSRDQVLRVRFEAGYITAITAERAPGS